MKEETNLKDKVWGELNKKLLFFIKESNWAGMVEIYDKMVELLRKEGKDYFRIQQESKKCWLMDYKGLGVEKVQILTAGSNNSCEHCLKLDRKIFTIDEALRIMPIPVKECTTEVFVEGKGFCRCCYAPFID